MSSSQNSCSCNMKSEAGFTMTELMVALLTGSLIVGFYFAAYFFSQKLFYEWDRKSCMTRLVNGAAQTIAADIRRAKSVTLVSDSLAYLGQIDGREVVYHFEKGNVTRNEIALNADSSIVTTARILTASNGYTVIVAAVSKFQAASAQVNVQQLESSALAFRASLVDAGAN